MYRKKGLVGLSVISLMLLLTFYLFSDQWIEKQIEDNAANIHGARIDMDGFNLSLLSLKLGWDKLQVTDKKNTMKNLFETGRCELDIEFVPLLTGKLIVENLQLSGFETGTDRETDGKIENIRAHREQSFVGSAINSLDDQLNEIPPLNLSALTQKINIDSVTAIIDLKSPARIDSLGKSLNEKYDYWKGQFENQKFDADFQKLKTRITKLGETKLDNVPNIITALSAVENIRKDINTLTGRVTEVKNNLTTDLDALTGKIGLIDNWIEDDLTKAMSMAALPDINIKNIGLMLFGDEMAGKVSNYLSYIELARGYSTYFEPEPEKNPEPERLEGQDIHFSDIYSRPDFWIKKLHLSGTIAKDLQIEGDAGNIVSDQNLINQPTEFNISGNNKGGVSLSLNGLFNYLDNKSEEIFSLTYKGFTLDNISISTSELLPNKIRSGTGIIETILKLTGDSLKGKIVFTSNNIQFDFSGNNEPKNYFEKIVQQGLKNISTLLIETQITTKNGSVQLGISSNLDKVILDSFNSIISGEIKNAKQKLSQFVDEQTSSYKNEINKLIGSNENLLRGKINQYVNLLTQNNTLLNSYKEKFEKEKKKLESGITDKILDLLK